MPLIEILFWACAAFLAWTYGGYPVVLALAGSFRKRAQPDRGWLPTVSLIFIPRRRDPLLERRLRAIAALDYPGDRLEILIGDPGGSPVVAGMVDTVADPRMRIVGETVRQAVAEARGELLVFADASSLPQAGLLRALAQHFADPTVGAVCGNRVHIRSRGDDCTLHAERLYADWDKWLRTLESRAASVVAPDRAPWAVRRTFRVDPPADRDAGLETAAAVIAAGARIRWEPSAIAWERGGDAEVRFDSRAAATRARVATLRTDPGLLFRHGGWSFVVLWHIVARIATPFVLGGLLLASVLLTGQGLVYEIAAVLQSLFYAAAALGWLARASRIGRAGGLCVPLFICLGWGAALAALAPRPAAELRAGGRPRQPWTTGRPPV